MTEDEGYRFIGQKIYLITADRAVINLDHNAHLHFSFVLRLNLKEAFRGSERLVTRRLDDGNIVLNKVRAGRHCW